MGTLNFKVDEKTFQRYIDAFVEELEKKENTLEFCDRNEFPAKAGVYSVFKGDTLIYVGESGNIKKRLCDLHRTKNHSLRRTLGKELFSHLTTFEEASEKKSFPVDIELKLNEYMEQNIFIKAMPTNFGRKEIEEAVVNRHGNALLNVRGKRE